MYCNDLLEDFYSGRFTIFNCNPFKNLFKIHFRVKFIFSPRLFFYCKSVRYTILLFFLFNILLYMFYIYVYVLFYYYKFITYNQKNDQIVLITLLIYISIYISYHLVDILSC